MDRNLSIPSTCCICGVPNTTFPSVAIRAHRVPYIRKWVSGPIHAESKAHVKCLECVGLCHTPNKYPRDGDSMGLSDHIRNIIKSVPRTDKNLIELCDQIWEAVIQAHTDVRKEITDPNLYKQENAIRLFVTRNVAPKSEGPVMPTPEEPKDTPPTPAEPKDTPPTPEEPKDTPPPSVQWLEAHNRGIERAIELESVSLRRARIAAAIAADNRRSEELAADREADRLLARHMEYLVLLRLRSLTERDARSECRKRRRSEKDKDTVDSINHPVA